MLNGSKTENKSLQKVTASDFFDKTNPESPFQHQDKIKKKQKKDLSRIDSNRRGIWVSFTNKNHLQ